MVKVKAPWSNPSDAPTIEQSLHDYVVSIFRMQSGDSRRVEIIPISPGAEAKRGWDAAVMEAVPLYLQYKLPDFTSRPAVTQAAVHTQRKEWGFDDMSGAFHFRLRAKAAKEPRSQHELLVDLQKQGARVYYLSTTFVDMTRLRFGGDLIHGRAWLDGYGSILHRNMLERVSAPIFQDLICIPPHANVDQPVEEHQFFFNVHCEASLHSDPEVVESLDFGEVLRDQISAFGTDVAITEGNVGEHVEAVLGAIANASPNSPGYRSVRSYFDSLVRASENPSHLMGSLRALARTTRQLTGLDVLLSIRKKIHGE